MMPKWAAYYHRRKKFLEAMTLSCIPLRLQASGMLYLKVSAENATPSLKTIVRAFTLDPEVGYSLAERKAHNWTYLIGSFVDILETESAT